jgi:futalosine hydrolase
LIPVKAVTVNTLHGSKESIKRVKEKFNPEIETMDGAAFFYVCLSEKVPFLQIRAISNFVEIHRIENWNIPLAIDNLTDTVIAIFDELRID